ncbi:hypothetical protein Bca4012_044128 [Brassica carinata]
MVLVVFNHVDEAGLDLEIVVGNWGSPNAQPIPIYVRLIICTDGPRLALWLSRSKVGSSLTIALLSSSRRNFLDILSMIINFIDTFRLIRVSLHLKPQSM